eukprot:334968-Amphidinium_carterae.1
MASHLWNRVVARDISALVMQCMASEGETAKELGTFWKGNKIVEGEFSISLADLQKMRKGEVTLRSCPEPELLQRILYE